ncbi:uncharacterized protein LOC125177798 [Hyalella azteca]|uniref:Uncharacterized protein LOC125177798 n=1 Tax=Hyalella azteca TaxID=294128 RepID=A0A979FGV0_HYAAZ|nr:uncharacterized protein LOC125177798 [Hyalella azteca]
MKMLTYLASCLMAASGAGALMLGALKASRITVGAFDFNYNGLQVTKYNKSTTVQCATRVLANVNATPVFCVTSAQECWLTNATFPAGYDNSSAAGALPHKCYTTIKPLFDKAAALAACGGNPSGCCPAPFENVTNVGCVFTSFWFFPMLPFDVARAFCKGMWPTGDLYSRPGGTIDFTALNTYLDRMGVVLDVWVGATMVGVGQFAWPDGSAVGSSNYGSVLIVPQPDLTGFPAGGPAGCLLVMRTYGNQKLGDDYCIKPVNYLCHIP